VCHTFVAECTGRRFLPEQTLTAAELKGLYEKHGAALAAYACCCGVDFATAEDIVQQVFLRLLREDVATPDAPLAYLYRAMRNAVLNLRRDRSRESPLPMTDTWFVHSSAPIEDVLALQDAMRDLPQEQSETIFLRVWSGMTLQEISQATGMPLNTIASRYHYALEKLRGLLRPLEKK
jgi:RNA polymerase sigma-70 factor, ECF subfamily